MKESESVSILAGVKYLSEKQALKALHLFGDFFSEMYWGMYRFDDDIALLIAGHLKRNALSPSLGFFEMAKMGVFFEEEISNLNFVALAKKYGLVNYLGNIRPTEEEIMEEINKEKSALMKETSIPPEGILVNL